VNDDVGDDRRADKCDCAQNASGCERGGQPGPQAMRTRALAASQNAVAPASPGQIIGQLSLFGIDAWRTKSTPPAIPVSCTILRTLRMRGPTPVSAFANGMQCATNRDTFGISQSRGPLPAWS
jgi:hypothetical protein